MFCRKDYKKGLLIQLEDREDRINKKYEAMKKDGDLVYKLVQVNVTVFIVIFTVVDYSSILLFLQINHLTCDIIGMVSKMLSVVW